MKAVVNRAVALSFRVPRVESLAKTLALGLDSEVDDGRRAAERRRARSRFEAVDRVRSTEGHFEVGVAVDRTRDHVLARRVNDAVRANLPKL